MIYHDTIQGSDEWFALRKGVLTSSRADMILTPKTCKPSASQKKLLCALIGERYSLLGPENVASYTNNAMRHGQQTEEESRRWFAMETGLTLQNGGFCQSDDLRFGASPDSIIGLSEDKRTCAAVLELKNPQHDNQTEYVIDGVLPDAYKCQCHMHLIITGAPICYFLSYHLGLPPLLLTVTPDEFTERLRQEIDAFHAKFVEALKRFQPVDPAESPF